MQLRVHVIIEIQQTYQGIAESMAENGSEENVLWKKALTGSGAGSVCLHRRDRE